MLLHLYLPAPLSLLPLVCLLLLAGMQRKPLRSHTHMPRLPIHRLIVAADDEVFVYSFPGSLFPKLLQSFETCSNPKGACNHTCFTLFSPEVSMHRSKTLANQISQITLCVLNAFFFRCCCCATVVQGCWLSHRCRQRTCLPQWACRTQTCTSWT